MKSMLRLPDFLDLEWFLKQDDGLSPRAVMERDRAIGLKGLASRTADSTLLGFWLAERRRAASGPLPSTLFRATRAVAAWALGLGGLLAGISLTRALLAYSGQSPVNVSVFLLVAVAPQTMLCLFSALFLLVRRTVPLPAVSLFSLVWSLVARHSALRRHAENVAALTRRHGRYGPLLLGEGLRLSHLTGAAFALGALSCLLVSVVATDLAFGWQSTLRTGATGMHHLVTVLSWPWSILPATWNLTPSLEQIEGSRIVLKDGVAALANADLVAWWPFLGMCLVVYALLPRLLLWGAIWRRLVNLERSFTHPDLARIEDRMRAPLVGMSAPGVREGATGTLPLHPAAQDASPTALVEASEAGCVALVPEEMTAHVEGSDLERLVAETCGYPLSGIVPLELDAQGARRAVEACSGLSWSGGFERFVVLIEAWQPPIRESLLALGTLCGENPNGRGVLAVLVGRPSGKKWLTAPTATESRTWTEALSRLAPAKITVFPVEEG